jgi:hypothetical protein
MVALSACDGPRLLSERPTPHLLSTSRNSARPSS